MEVGENLSDHRLQLWNKNKVGVTAEQGCARKRQGARGKQRAAHLRISILKPPVRGHVFDDVSKNGVDLAFLKEREHFISTEHNMRKLLRSAALYSL